MRQYEGLFLVNDKKASDDYQGVTDHVREILQRFGAEVNSLENWDSRRLAYEIDGRKRGTYLIVKFAVDPTHIAEIRHECLISNVILRAMILREENVGIFLEDAERKVRELKRQAGGDQSDEEGDNRRDDREEDDTGDARDDDSDDDDDDSEDE